MMMWAKFQLLSSRAMCWWVIHRRWNLFGRNLTRHKKRFEYDHDDGFDLMIKISTIKLTAIKLICAWLLNVPTESWPFFPNHYNHPHFFTYFNLSSRFQLLPLLRSYKEGGKQKEDRRLSLYYTHKITPDRFCPDLSVFGWVSLRDSLSQMRRRRRTKLTMPALSWVLAVQGFICLAFTIVAIVASQPG